jgi:hypothetical protein
MGETKEDSPYISLYKDLLAASSSSTLFTDSLEAIESSRDDYGTTEIEFAQLQVQFLSQVTNATIQSAMNTALLLWEKQEKLELEKNILIQEEKKLKKDIATAGITSSLR